MTKLNAVWWGLAGSGILLVIFFIIQSAEGNLLDLPVRWHLTALLPFIASLAVAGYRITVNLVTGRFEISHDVEKLKKLPEQEKQLMATAQPSPTHWTAERTKEYDRTHHYMLTHEYRPSKDKPGYYDIFIFVVRHEKGSDKPPRKQLDKEITKAEFFFGESWGNQVFTAPIDKGVIGVRTVAWGTFLATCHLTLKDSKDEPTLFRYIDFSMVPGNT